MKSNNYLGIDIGHDRLKLASVRSGKVVKIATVPMPENLIKNGRIVSQDTMAELIKKTAKANGMKEKSAALLLPADAAYVKSVVMPVMTADQLAINLPFEFRDYFNEELHDYLYDYAMYGTNEDGSMELLAVAVRKTVVADFKDLIRLCGLKPEIIAPAASAMQNLIRHYESHGGNKNEEYCILDIGFKNIHMNFFKGEKHIAMRELENGMEMVDQAIANMYNVDKHLAHTYLVENFENCQSKPACIDAYNALAVEILRSINFYQFSNPDRSLNHVFIAGGGAQIVEMIKVFKEVISDMDFHDASELIPGTGQSSQTIDENLLAIGIALV